MKRTVQSSSVELADRARAEVADLLDLQLSPLGLAAIDALAPRSGQTMLDIGCGAGQTLLQLAGRVGRIGRVIGVDIAPRVLEIARARAAGIGQIRVMQADATTLTLPDETADCVFSRFGVMAFAEPIGAFADFRRITKRGGRLGFVCWRSLRENELDLFPLQAAGLDASVDMTPYRFERSDYLEEVLGSAGWRGIAIEAFDAPVSSGDVHAMTTVLTRVGALGRLLRECPALRQRSEAKVRTALEQRECNSVISLVAATWVVTAEA